MTKVSSNLFSALLLILIIGLLGACHSPPRFALKAEFSSSDIYHDSIFEPLSQVPSLDDVFYLTETQKQLFLEKFHSQEFSDLSGSLRVAEYLKDHLQYFNFQSATLMASDAISKNAGNCMSLAILTKSLSDLVGTVTGFELARTASVFQRENSLELNSQHIRTVVHNKTTFKSKDLIKTNDQVVIDYFSASASRTLRKVKNNEFYSLIYSNLAAESLIKNNYNQSYWLIKQSLHHKHDNLISINMLGVLYERVEQQSLAEKAYLHGLQFDGNQLELLNNYHQLLVAENRSFEANEVAQILAEYDDPDPFKWLNLADKQFDKGHYRKAITYYEKATKKAHYLHQPYAGLAKANFMLGRPKQAIKALEKALNNTHTQQSTSIYQAKYEYMKSNSDFN